LLKQYHRTYKGKNERQLFKMHTIWFRVKSYGG
jgi:hypothetical protein